MILHWWFLDNNCILDVLARKICPYTTYSSFNTRGIGIDDITFSNVVQVLIAQAIVIAISTLYGKPISKEIRLLMLIVNIVVVIFIIRIVNVHKIIN